MPGWTTNWPPTQGVTDLTKWPVFIELWYSLNDLNILLGGDRFPRLNRTEAVGRVVSATATVVTCEVDDTMGGWMSPAWSADYWISGSPPHATPGGATTWDVVIHVEGEDPRYMVRSTMSGSGANTLTISSLANQLTAINRTVGDLASKPFFCIPVYGVWTPDRWPKFPNPAFDVGTVFAGTATTLTVDPDNSHSWATNQHATREVLYYDGSSILHRVKIVSNTGNVLTFASATAPAAGANWCIVTAGFPATPGRIAGCQSQYNGGEFEDWGTRHPNETLAAARMSKSAITYPVWNGSSCAGFTVNAMDTDVWSVDNDAHACWAVDYNFTPRVYSTLRGIQAVLQNSLCYLFVEPRSDNYHGWAYDIHNFTIAEWFVYAGINPVTIPWTNSTEVPVVVFVTVKRAGGTVRKASAKSGSDGLVYSDTYTVNPGDTLDSTTLGMSPGFNVSVSSCSTSSQTVTFGGGAPANMEVGSHLLGSIIFSISGATILLENFANTTISTPTVVAGTNPGDTAVASLTWTAALPREFRHFYDHAAFIPDQAIGGSAAIDPAAVVDWALHGSYGVGRYAFRAKSTKYRECDVFGFYSTGAETIPFVDGDLARYVGDNWCDPTIPEVDPGGVDWAAGMQNYYNRFFEGKELTPPTKSGSIVSGSTYYIETAADFWTMYGGQMRVETGTATGGSTTTLIDTAKLPAAGAASAFWEAVRFSGFAGGPYSTFILEVDHGGTTYYLPITGGNPATATLTFAAVTGLTVTAADAYRIREPYQLNRFAGRTLGIIKGDGTSVTLTITHNDQHRLFFAAQSSPIGAGSWSIDERAPGTVWLRRGGAWIKPPVTEHDDRDTDHTDSTWPDDQTTIRPTLIKRYRRTRNGDYELDETRAEIYRGRNALRWLLVTDVYWTNADNYDAAYAAYLIAYQAWIDSGFVGDPPDVVTPDPGHSYSNGKEMSESGTIDMDRATAEAAYDALPDVYNAWTDPDLNTESFPPFKVAIAKQGDTGDGHTFWQLRAASQRAHLRISVAAELRRRYSSSAVFLAYSTATHGAEANAKFLPVPLSDVTFNAGGVSVQEDKWVVINTDSPSTDAVRTSDMLGNLTLLALPAGTSAGSGFIVTRHAVILKFDVSGGMGYHD